MLEQKWLENNDIYYIGAAELPFRFPRCAPLLGWRYLYVRPLRSPRHVVAAVVPFFSILNLSICITTNCKIIFSFQMRSRFLFFTMLAILLLTSRAYACVTRRLRKDLVDTKDFVWNGLKTDVSKTST